MKMKKLFGDRAFYRRTLAIALPMIIQNAITNLVNLLDNVMVGALGTEQMSGTSIVNQFVFIFNLAIFGAISAAGIFTAQYNGKGDNDGIRYTMRAKLAICAIIGTVGVAVFILFGSELISSFLHEGTEGNLEATLRYGEEYISLLVIGFIPYAISQAYASTLREIGETVVPMVSSVASVITNFIFNGILIFGLLGIPALGVVGAAIATSLSRFVELSILVVWTHTHSKRCPFAKGLFSSVRVPRRLLCQIGMKGLPILANEMLWSLSVTMRNQCYSTRGLDVVAALNITMTLLNLLSVSYLALSNSVGIIMGNMLGAGKIEEAKEENRRLLFFAAEAGIAMMLLQLSLSSVFPLIYNTSDAVRSMATDMIALTALSMPLAALATSSYYTIRSGGRVIVTLLFDSVYAWIIMMPVAASLAYFTSLPILPLMVLVMLADNLKVIPGLLLVRKGSWAKKLKID